MISGPPSANCSEIPAECSRQSKVSNQVCETVCSAPAVTVNVGRKAAATASTSTGPSLLNAREDPAHGTPFLDRVAATARRTINTVG